MEDETLPPEIEGICEDFHQSLLRTDAVLKKLLAVPHESLDENLTTLDKARLNLTLCYAIDSLFWAFLMVQGVPPREHAVQKELDRVKQYMGKLKEIEEKEMKPEKRLNKGAAQRFVRSALWEPTEQTEGNENASDTEERGTDKMPDGELANVKKIRKRKKSKAALDKLNGDDGASGDTPLIKKLVKKRKQKNGDESTDTSQSDVMNTEDMETVHGKAGKNKKRTKRP
ncbi:nuclear nucleic acid-binding protein C1D-like [Corticium candelabrum]|uniref:nuclear nucleic acid-binding protein C1D-like n=1 Tax=Corticium candelabrum TaxID=121492 RepID=UPI002E2563C3|nr:nuclear nucleic acid-binding protein C1D-like [Corticium candelabrum]